ncbi:MAG: hypothetical protein FJ222_11585 [Lentisphaerae bacterium]|nr:hypothetical protein [Lentisphaerota bacterium]
MHPSTHAADAHASFTPVRAVRFYIPLVIQAVSQSFTYPLVAMVVSRGPGGVADFGAFAQGQAVFFLLGALGAGLLTTGMVYGRTRLGFERFQRLSLLFIIVIVVMQLLLSLPPFDHLVFDRLLALEPGMQRIARDTLLYSIPANILFLLRTPYQAILYNARASSAANAATLGRIAATVLLSYLFVHARFVGHIAGIIAFTLPVFGEYYVSRLLSRAILADLPQSEARCPSMREQFLFCIPLSFGGLLLALSGFMTAAFITRAADPVRMLPIHYVAMGVVNPACFAAIRMQAVVLAFPPDDQAGAQTFRFACVAGLALACVLLLGQIPAIAGGYFGVIQNLPAADIPLAMRVMLVACGLPVLQTLRGHAEGLAAWRKRPNAILAGQAVYLASLVCALFFFLTLGVPGYLMGVCAIAIAVTATFLTIRMGLLLGDLESRIAEFGPRHGEEGDPP